VVVRHASGFSNFDSTWLACDGWASSPNEGNCYFEFDDFGQGALFEMSRSTDGGLTWTASSVPGGQGVIGGKPTALPNGTVVVPIDTNPLGVTESFVSTDGGSSYTGPFTVASQQVHTPAGGLRTLDIVSATADASGTAYVVWYDCRFRTSCSSNDIVMSTSTDGKTWTAPVRIPIDPTSSTVDHFLPGIEVDPATSGASAHLALVYYFYPVSSCSTSTCDLDYGIAQSRDGGATWSRSVQVTGPISLPWLPNTTSGYMVGDYTSVSFASGHADSVFAVARPGTCQLGQVGSCNEFMAALTRPFGAGPTQAVDRPPVVGHGASPSGLASSR
jgi:hypothetical protein